LNSTGKKKIMGDLELIGKIIAQNFFDASDLTASEEIDPLTDTVITSSDNAT
uniref:Uncharacterized protein n=1 Tax=Panagrolaimus sp. PS1159 TaxID=55785 RepID=A0AC35FN20_9BILA